MSSKDNKNLVALCATNDEIHEIQITSALNDAHIEHVVHDFYDQAFDGLFEAKYGHSKILVFEEDLQNAKKIIDQIPSPNEPDSTQQL